MAKRKKPPKKTPRKKRPIVDPCPSYSAWSMARYRSFIRSAMRKAWQKWPPRYEALHAVKRPYRGSNPRQKFEYQCAHCSKWLMGKEVRVDHITPWGSIIGLSHDEAWARLLVPMNSLQVLCEPCHDIKTAAEKETRS